MFITLACECRDKPKIPTDGLVVVTAAEPVNNNRIYNSSCPPEMVEVNDIWCPHVEQICLSWVDATGRTTDAPKTGMTGRCGEFKKPAKCLTPENQRPRKHFCVDVVEFGASTTERPRSWMSWFDAKAELEKQGKRLCTDSEWTMACEGPTWQPYPYDDGYHRDRDACNFDNSLSNIDVFKATSHNTETARKLDFMLIAAGSMSRCVSPWGVRDMVGNIDEWTVNESGSPHVSSLRGGHIFGVRNACRPRTEAHGPTFSWYETGTRGCRDIHRISRAEAPASAWQVGENVKSWKGWKKLPVETTDSTSRGGR